MISLLPEKIFYTGAPGSKWSGVAQKFEQNHGFDTSDRTPYRQYSHGKFSGHIGAYFGTGMEFPALVDDWILKKPYSDEGIPLLKSHEWVYKLPEIQRVFPDDWIVFVWRDSEQCFDWWKQVGGWNITYPNYDWYVNDKLMYARIEEQNQLMLDFAALHNLAWHQQSPKTDDVWVAVYKP